MASSPFQIVADTEPRTKADLRGKKSDPGVRHFECLQDAITHVVYHARVAPKVLADACGVDAKYLYNAANPYESQKLRLDLVEPLTNASGNPAILRHLADRCGYVLVKKPASGQMAALDLVQHLARIACEAGDVMRDGGDVLADGSVCAADIRRMRQSLGELLEVAHACDLALAAMER
jgi:hypothetical protein